MVFDIKVPNFTSSGVLGIALLLIFLFAGPGSAAAPSGNTRPNILFIVVDDLRPELGAYDRAHIHSPNIDRLAEGGTVFLNAYAQQAVCSPSRTSVMTGLRPDSPDVWHGKTHFRDIVPDVITLPQHFKNHGYRAIGLGKIYHAGLKDDLSWSKPWWQPKGAGIDDQLLANDYALAKNLELVRTHGRGSAYENADVADDIYVDGQIADRGVRELRELVSEGDGRPFFLAVGFVKPHLPYTAPRKYWNLYDSDKTELPSNTSAPRNAPPQALTNWGELRNYYGIPRTGPLNDETTRILRRGYYASVSYIDAQVGRLLEEVDRLGITENTIVVLWGDHGVKLGENGMWSKHTNFELDTRTALIVRAPGLAQGSRSSALVELVDIYPTLCVAAGLPLPGYLEGLSFFPLLSDPAIPWKQAAFSQMRRKNVIGSSMRTNRYRLTVWKSRGLGWKERVKILLGMDTEAVELYDYLQSPEEVDNVAKNPEYAETLKILEPMMSRGWQAVNAPGLQNTARR